MTGSLRALELVSKQLMALGVDFAFAGGSILPFLLDQPALHRIRATDDVDAIANVVTMAEYNRLEQRLRSLGFSNDTSENAPICRWIYAGVKIDIIPAIDPTGTMQSPWFSHALQTATDKTVNSITVPTISATTFIASKAAAFQDRGKNDYYGSHDLEDIVTVVNGRLSLSDEIGAEISELKTYVVQFFKKLLSHPEFRNALPGHLEPDIGSQMRLPIVLERFNSIAATPLA